MESTTRKNLPRPYYLPEGVNDMATIQRGLKKRTISNESSEKPGNAQEICRGEAYPQEGSWNLDPGIVPWSRIRRTSLFPFFNGPIRSAPKTNTIVAAAGARATACLDRGVTSKGV